MATYTQELREMDAPSHTTGKQIPFPPSLCGALRRAGLPCDYSGYKQAVRLYGGATVSYDEFVIRLQQNDAAPQ